MESPLLEIDRDLMTYEGKINHSAKRQKVLTKPAWALGKRGHPGGGGGVQLDCGGSAQQPRLAHSYHPCWTSAVSKGGRPVRQKTWTFFPWLKWWWSTSWWKPWAWVKRKRNVLLEEGTAEKLWESNHPREVLTDLNPAQPDLNSISSRSKESPQH